MKKAIFFLWISQIVFISFYACDSDYLPDAGSKAHSVLIDGFVTNELGLSIPGALVEFGNEETITNADGYFQLPSVSFQDYAYIKINKPGYFPGSRTLLLKESDTAHIRISLLEKTFSKSFSSNSGGNIDIDGKVRIEFPSHVILYQDGNPYNGTVQVAVKYLDPSNNNIGEIMPGNLIGLNFNGQQQGLGSYAMAAIELQSTTGDLLKIDENKPVLLKLKIPESLRSTAPATLPLWYFDESKGLWIEEGSALKIGNYYEGKVKHFSFWNCDISLPLVNISGRLVSHAGEFLVKTKVKLTMISNSLTRYGYTDSYGRFNGPVPKDQIFNMEILNHCNEQIHIQQIGPFAQDADLGNIISNQIESSLKNIKGKVVNTMKQPIPKLRVEFRNLNLILKRDFTNDMGEFTYSVPNCIPGYLQLLIFDPCNKLVYNSTIKTIDSDVDLGELEMPLGTVDVVTIKGNVIDCNSNNLYNALVIITSGQNVYETFSNQSGNYNLTIPICDTNYISIKAFDNLTRIFSTSTTYNLPGPIEALPIEICKYPKNGEYLKYQFSDGVSGSYNFGISMDNSFGVYSVFTNTTDPWFELKWYGPGSVGNKAPVKEISLRNSGTYYIAKYYNNTDGTILFKSIPKASGEFFEGTFEGINVKKQDVKTGQLIETGITVSGSFKIKKE